MEISIGCSEVANESHESYINRLQIEYVAVGQGLSANVDANPLYGGYVLEDFFLPSRKHPQKESIPASAGSLYDQVQVD